MDPRSTDEQKSKKWQETLALVDRITDKLGMPVDRKIKSVVAGLMALGFKTTSSCQGHLDHGKKYPSVTIELDALPQTWGKGPPPDDITWREYCQKALSHTRPTVKRLFDLIAEFYGDRAVHHDVRIGLRGGLASLSMENSNAEMTQWLCDGGQEERLMEYQEEMLAFGEFLRKKFLQT
jgi:hypothetical protein